MAELPPRAGLSVLMPAYNEADGLERSVTLVSEHLSAHGYDFEIVIVDDASTDATPQIARALAAASPHVRVVRHERNQGPCSGLKTGPAHVTKPWVLLLPVDLAIPLHDIETLWAARGGSDIVLGYVAREAREGARRVQSQVYTRIVNALFGMTLRQVNYVALYRTELLRELTLTTSGVALHAEILVRAARAGGVLTQLALGYEPRTVGVASGNKPRVVLKTLREILALRVQLLGERSPRSAH